jgi:radical SAM superfamily enzyme YgiQ (UPF0313 family)
LRVCFVDPKGVHFGLNTGIGYIVSYLQKVRGVEDIKVFDFNNNGDDTDARIREISRYDVIGFSIKSFTRDSALDIAYKVKNENNVLIAGGPHITLDGLNFLREHAIFDFGVAGEGEAKMADLLQMIETSKEFESVPGLFYRQGQETVFSGNPERIADLDDLPYPDYNTFDSVRNGRIYNYPLVTSRGCPYLCTYCCVKGVMGRKWIARSVDNVICELKHAKEFYKIECFNIQDDNFSMNLKRAKAFCDSLLDEKLILKWSCPNGIRADRLDDELMKKMRASGCFAVAMGIESGVEEEFRAIKKGEDLSDIVEAVELARRNKIQVFGNFIIGLPNSTLETIRKSVIFARKLHLESCIFNLFVPFPGTEVWGWVRENGRMLMDWKDGFTQGKNPRIVFDTEEFPKEDRLKAYYEANIKCKNYFAFMDEHDGLIGNILNVLRSIIKYDAANIFEHFFWWIRHSGRIMARITEKNV